MVRSASASHRGGVTQNIFALALLLLTQAFASLASAQPTQGEQTAASHSDPEALRADRRVAISLGFAHWFGETFNAPDGMTTPTLSVGMRPGLSFLELRLRYSLAVKALPLPERDKEHVGFAALEVALTHGLEVGSSRIDLLAGPFAGLVHAGGVAPAPGALFGAQWTVRVVSNFALGGFFEGRMFWYVLPDDSRNLFSSPRRDAQIDLGLLATFR